MIFLQPDFSVQPRSTAIPDTAFLVVFRQGKVLLCEHDGELCPPTLTEAKPLLPDDFVPFELAHTEEHSFCCPPPYDDVEIGESDSLRYYNIHIFRTLSFDNAALVITCWHLWTWYQNNRFCGSCGHSAQPDSAERAIRCPSCGRMIYPMIAPAVIVAITCGSKILLAKNAHSAFHHYTLISGYVEVGETLEHALRREVKEEVGLELSSIRYIGNQPWGFSSSHMFAFQAEADDSQPLVIQRSELSEARWFDRDELEPRERSLSIASELMERFRTGTL